MTSRLFLAFFLSFLFVGTSVFAETPSPTPFATTPDSIAAIVNNEPITLADLDKAVTAQPAFGFYKSVSGEDISSDMMNEFRWTTLPEMINGKIMSMDIKRSLSVDFIALRKEAEANLIAQMGGEDKIDELAKAFRFSKSMLIEKAFQEKIMALYKEKVIAPTVTVTKEEVDAALKEMESDPTSGPRTQLSHILLKSTEQNNAEILARIQAVRARVMKGTEKFEDIAKEVSECPSAPKGGDLGLVTKGVMVPEFENAAFALSEGAISEPVKTQFGYHLIKAGKKESDSAETRQAKAETRARNKKIQLALVARTEELKEKASVKILLPEKKKSPVPATTLTIMNFPPPSGSTPVTKLPLVGEKK